MTRCIHCTRCVRFESEICGSDSLGTLNRGESTEIGNYSSSLMSSELSGNVIDLCPVGALTSKTYSFKARPWELQSIESIDTTDSTGSNTFVHVKEREIYRITPRSNKDINGSLISDRARFLLDIASFKRQLQHPFTVQKLPLNKNSKFQKEFQVKSTICLDLQRSKQLLGKSGLPLYETDGQVEVKRTHLFLLDSTAHLISIHALKDLSFIFDNLLFVRTLSNPNLSNFSINWSINKINALNSISHLCFCVGINLKLESTIINARLRRKYLKEDLSVFSLLSFFESNFDINFWSLRFNDFFTLVKAKTFFGPKLLCSYHNPIFFFNENILLRNTVLFELFLLIKTLFYTSSFFFVPSSSNSNGLSFLNVKKISQNILNRRPCLLSVNLTETLELYSLCYKANFSCLKHFFSTHQLIRKEKQPYTLPGKLLFFFKMRIFDFGLTTTSQARGVVKFIQKYKLFLVRGYETLFHTDPTSIKTPITLDFEEEQLFLNLEQRIQKTSCVLPIRKNIKWTNPFLFYFTPFFIHSRSSLLNNMYSSFFFEILRNNTLFENVTQPRSYSWSLQALSLFLNNSTIISNYPLKNLVEDFYKSSKSTRYSHTLNMCSQEHIAIKKTFPVLFR
jgi:hypothetical protein